MLELYVNSRDRVLTHEPHSLTKALSTFPAFKLFLKDPYRIQNRYPESDSS